MSYKTLEDKNSLALDLRHDWHASSSSSCAGSCFLVHDLTPGRSERSESLVAGVLQPAQRSAWRGEAADARPSTGKRR